MPHRFLWIASVACLTLHALNPTAAKSQDAPIVAADFQKEVVTIINGRARGSAPYVLTARRLADRIGKFVTEVKATDLGADGILDQAHERTHKIIDETVTRRPKSWILALDAVVKRIREESQKETTPEKRRERVLSLIEGPVKAALVQIGGGSTQVTKTDVQKAIAKNIENAFTEIADPAAQKAFAKALIERVKQIDNESADYQTKDRAVSRMRAQMEDVISKSGLTAKKQDDIRKEAEAILGTLAEKSANVKDLLKKTNDYVVAAVVPYTGKADSPDALGLTDFVVQQAGRYRAFLQLDVLRDQTASQFASIYEEASEQVTAVDAGDPIEFNKKVLAQTDEVRKTVDDRAKRAGVAENQLPWTNLFEAISLQLNLLAKEKKFSLRNNADWHVVYFELAEGFKQLAKDFRKPIGAGDTSGLTRAGSGGSGRLGSDLGLSGFSAGNPYDLKMKLELRREYFKIQRKMMKEESDARRKLAKERSEEQRKLGEQKLEQTLKDFRRQLRAVVDD